MARINLLPWREERRKHKTQEFYAVLAGTAVIALALFGAATFIVGSMIDNQQQRNQRLNTEIAALDRRIEKIEELEEKRRELLARKEIIEELQANRSQMVHLFDEMVRTIPEGVRLTSIKQKGDTLTLDGTAQSNARVSSYMRSLQASPWLGIPELNVTQLANADRDHRYRFSVRVKLADPDKEEELPDEEWAE